MTAKNLLLFGATGKTGHEVLTQALAAGHTVTAIVRSPDKLAARHQNLRVLKGDIADAASIVAAFDRPYDAVISALGVYLSKPGTTLADGTKPIVAAMRDKKISRIILCSSYGASDTKNGGPIWVKGVQYFILRHTLADKTEQEKLIMSSGLDWTIVRPPRLMDGRATHNIVRWTGKVPPHGAKVKWAISRADVAAEMLRAAGDATTVKSAYQISDPA